VYRVLDTCHVYVVAAPQGPDGERTGYTRVAAGGEVVLTATLRNPWPEKVAAWVEPVVRPAGGASRERCR
ncbi:hypothetical protein JYK22_20245, partial [Nonomuraea sp. RK-328]|nr:hypothetical protein [Nonomuraea sp. RK-328]